MDLTNDIADEVADVLSGERYCCFCFDTTNTAKLRRIVQVVGLRFPRNTELRRSYICERCSEREQNLITWIEEYTKDSMKETIWKK